ncbi:hypothetical protein BaRGS_00024596 [Batillaria attramentaria]|uniref:HAT C-terminal dimerisation domain-containing protein n=1 Tax=Batillaria attramentaria TaxID=370345 RepID=A0ABD0KAL8_9CAEN
MPRKRPLTTADAAGTKKMTSFLTKPTPDTAEGDTSCEERKAGSGDIGDDSDQHEVSGSDVHTDRRDQSCDRSCDASTSSHGAKKRKATHVDNEENQTDSPHELTTDSDLDQSSQGDGIKSLTTLWETDFHNIHMIEPEFMRWCTKWSMEMKKEEPIIPSSLTEAIKTCNKALFPNLHQLMRLIMTLPITTSECERSVSRLRSLKNYLRSTMGAERFNGLALMQVHRQRPVDVMAAVNTFAMRFRTKMALRPKTLLNEDSTDE